MFGLWWKACGQGLHQQEDWGISYLSRNSKGTPTTKAFLGDYDSTFYVIYYIKQNGEDRRAELHKRSNQYQCGFFGLEGGFSGCGEDPQSNERYDPEEGNGG